MLPTGSRCDGVDLPFQAVYAAAAGSRGHVSEDPRLWLRWAPPGGTGFWIRPRAREPIVRDRLVLVEPTDIIDPAKETRMGRQALVDACRFAAASGRLVWHNPPNLEPNVPVDFLDVRTRGFARVADKELRRDTIAIAVIGRGTRADDDARRVRGAAMARPKISGYAFGTGAVPRPTVSLAELALWRHSYVKDGDF